MHDYDNIVRERQKAIRREIDRRGTPSITMIQADGRWPNASTVLSWFPANKDNQPAVMSVANLFRLLATKALSPELLSMLLPEEFAIIRKPEGIDHDEIAPLLHDYLLEKQAAHHRDSEDGPAIGPGEHKRLTAKLTVIARSVAA